MIRFAIRASIAGAVFAAAFALVFFAGCGDNDEENPPPPSPAGAAGTYYGIADLGGGEGLETEDRIKLLIEQGSAVATGGNSPLQSMGIASDSLTGYISYGDSTYIVFGTTRNDSLGIGWTTALGAWVLIGTFDAQGIQGIAAGPIGSDTLTLYRRTGSTRNIADRWLGHYSMGSCWPSGGTLRAYFSQSDTLITGTLVVSGAYEMGDTLTIYEGSFFDPILELQASSSFTDSLEPPSVLHLLGTLGSADSMAGTFDWWWDRCLDEGIWDLVRSEPDTGAAFAGIMAVAYRREDMDEVMSWVYVEWEIDEVDISGATISVNGVPLTDYGDGFYGAQTGALTVVPGEDYIFNIFHPDYGSTTRTAHVPGAYTVTSPLQGAVVPMGQDLVVSFTQASDATFYDAYFQMNPAGGITTAPATLLMISGIGIQTSGADVLDFEAACGDYDQWTHTFTGFYGVNSKSINVTVQ